jgi:hypothetical protein
MRTIILKNGEQVLITTEENNGKTYIYITASNGKINIEGGASVIGKISGYGMANKVTD